MGLYQWGVGDRITAALLNDAYNLLKGVAGGTDKITLISGSALDMAACATSSGFLPPASAGAAPTADGVVAYDSTAKTLTWGDGSAARVPLSSAHNVSTGIHGLSSVQAVVGWPLTQVLSSREFTNDTSSGTGVHAVTGAGQLYVLRKSHVNDRETTTTSIFNITGCSTRDGSFAFIRLIVERGTSTNVCAARASVQIDGNEVIAETSAGPSSAATSVGVTALVARFNGVWNAI